MINFIWPHIYKDTVPLGYNYNNVFKVWAPHQSIHLIPPV